MPDPTETVSRVATLPAGTRNFMTAAGAALLGERLQELVAVQRPTLADRSSDPDARYELQKLDAEIRRLQESLRTADIVNVGDSGPATVRFGSTVVVRDREGEESTYRIVGVDETDLFPDAISWLSPLARALTQARVGDRVAFQAPRGEQELEVLEIR